MKSKKKRRKIVFDSNYYFDKGDFIEIAIPNEDMAAVHKIDKTNILEIEDYKPKRAKKRKVINLLTGY